MPSGLASSHTRRSSSPRSSSTAAAGSASIASRLTRLRSCDAVNPGAADGLFGDLAGGLVLERARVLADHPGLGQVDASGPRASHTAGTRVVRSRANPR